MAAAILAAGMPLALLTVPASARASVAPSPQSCSGNGCSGLDPTLTYLSGSNPRAYCGDGSQTVDKTPGVFGGLLELRWGPNCQTNWVRFTPSNNDTYAIGLSGSDLSGATTAFAGDGLDQLYVFSGKGIAHYSDQVYSPGLADPCVADVTTGSALICFPQTES